MKNRWMICLALVLCLLCSMAAADGTYSYNGYATQINLATKTAIPYTWEVQTRNGSPVAWGLDYMTDGRQSTMLEYVGWNDIALDEIPEITLHFAGATIKDLWVRNTRYSDSPDYLEYARLYRVDVTIWCGNEEEPRGTYIFNKIPDECDPELLDQNHRDGYYRLGLPEIFTNVTKVELWLKGWYPGEGDRKTKYWMQIGDLLFLPDAPENLTDDTYYPVYYYTPDPYASYTTPAPSAGPEASATPFPGIQVITKQRLATRSGPGTVYTGQGSYFQSGKWVKALSAAYDEGNKIWWIQVELEYAGELRRVYTGVQRLVMSADQVPVEEAGNYAYVTRSVYGYWGPGYGYTMYGDMVPAGTEGTVWQREASYAQFEYFDETTQQLRRIWIPENALEEESDNG